jgi:hypothetical protein
MTRRSLHALAHWSARALPSHHDDRVAVRRADAASALVLSRAEGPEDVARTTLYVRLPAEAFGGVSFTAAARLLDADLVFVEPDEASFTLLLAEPASRAPSTIRLLEAMGALDVEVAHVDHGGPEQLPWWSARRRAAWAD